MASISVGLKFPIAMTSMGSHARSVLSIRASASDNGGLEKSSRHLTGVPFQKIEQKRSRRMKAEARQVAYAALSPEEKTQRDADNKARYKANKESV